LLDPFADAQTWYDRAQEHIKEYRGLAYDQHDRIWQLHSGKREDGSVVHSLRFDRNLLTRLRPIACEAANALFQALDNIIGAAARQSGVERTPQIAWPWAIESDPDYVLPGVVRPAIKGRLDVMQKRGLPDVWLSFVETTFAAAPAVDLLHIDVVKEVSLSGKHWELVPTQASALAIAWSPEGSTKQVHAEIPEGHFETHDEYVFWEGEPIVAPHFQLATGTRLVAAEKEFQPEPVSAFEYTSRFVASALKGARRIWEEVVT
jgi:hypothetical protein